MGAVPIPGRSPLGLRGLKSISLDVLMVFMLSQPTRAAWIEISKVQHILGSTSGRSPLGLRGLKYFLERSFKKWNKSQPTRAAWIEIFREGNVFKYSLSQPTRAAWIEIFHIYNNQEYLPVAAHSGCVD